MNHKSSHPLIRNTYNFQTAHQRQAKEALRHPIHPSPLTSHPPKFAHSIQQLQSKIEGMENFVRNKTAVTDFSARDNEQALRNKNIDKRSEGSKGKAFLQNSLSGTDLRLHDNPNKSQDHSPIRKSYRFPEPKKYTDESPVKIPPINLHAITGVQPSSCGYAGTSAASSTTSGSPPRKQQLKCEQSRSFMENLNEGDNSFTLKLNGSILEEQRSTEISLFPSGSQQKEERGLKGSRTLSYLGMKQTLNQLRTRTASKRPTKNTEVQGFELGRVLGKGKFGEVYLGRHIITGFLVALKKLEKAKLKQFGMGKQFLEEARLHMALEHPTIVRCYALLEEPDCFYLVLEYLNGGTLFDFQNEVGILAPKQAADFLRDVIEALAYLHGRSIAHRDIKPQNIVLCSGVAKLCDFGWAALVDNPRSTFCGTLDYAPPEIIERRAYDCSVDLWCLGILAYELFVGRAPFEGQDRKEIMTRIVNIDKDGIPLADQLPRQARELVQALLQKDPSKRPRLGQLYDYPLFANHSPAKSKKDRPTPK